MRYLIFLLITLSITSVVHGQNAGSAYTSLGLGALEQRGVVYNRNMGGLGLSNGNQFILNIVNPALLPLNSFTMFEVGVEAEQRTLLSDTLSQKNTSGDLKYLVLGIPLSDGRWTMALGLKPFSTLSYKATSSGPVVNSQDSSKYTFEGKGGINEIFMSHGVLINKDLSVGINLSYLFGKREELTGVTPYNTTRFIAPTSYHRTINYSGLSVDLGLAYHRRVKKDLYLNGGVVFNPGSDLLGGSLKETKNEWLMNSIDLDKDGQIPSLIITDDQSSEAGLPQKLSVGVSISKFYKYTLGIDFHSEQWSTYKGASLGGAGQMSDAYKLIVGGEYTPDHSSVKSYLKRINYQMGVSYEKTPYTVRDVDIYNTTVNFGMIFPVGGASRVNLGFSYGTIGTLDKKLIKENYFKVRLGICFNDRSFGWYRKQMKLN